MRVEPRAAKKPKRHGVSAVALESAPSGSTMTASPSSSVPSALPSPLTLSVRPLESQPAFEAPAELLTNTKLLLYIRNSVKREVDSAIANSQADAVVERLQHALDETTGKVDELKKEVEALRLIAQELQTSMEKFAGSM